jgi:hypothetical protein
MVDFLQITLNEQTYKVENTIQEASTLLSATGYDPEKYDLYRIDGGEEIGPLGEMLVFDAGDEFVAIPKQTTGG